MDAYSPGHQLRVINKLVWSNLIHENMIEKTQHSSRMHATRCENVRVSVSIATTRKAWVGSEMNKFEQVSSYYHQMPLAGRCAEGMPRGVGSWDEYIQGRGGARGGDPTM